MTARRLAGTIGRVRADAKVGGVCLGLLLVASAAGGQPCPCAKRDLAAVVEQADVIFVGRPLAATTDSAATGGQPALDFQARLAFDVALVLKGSTTRATTVVTPIGPCGFPFAVGTDYLVVGRRQDGRLVTDACQGNVAGVEAIGARAGAIRGALESKASPPAPTATP